MRRFTLLSCALLSACGAAASHSAGLPTPPLAASGKSAATAAIRIVVPRAAALPPAARARQPEYVSAATASAAVTLTPSGATPGSPVIFSCGATCSGQVPANTGSSSLVVSTFDGPNGTGRRLSTSTTNVTIAAGVNAVNLTLNPIVSSVSALLTGATFNPGTASAATATIAFKDADGNTIIGPGSPIDANGNPVTVALASSETGGNTTVSVTPSTVSSVTNPTATVSYNGNSLYGGQVSFTTSPVAIASPAPIAYTIGPVNVHETVITGGSQPEYMALGPDGNVWFADIGSGKIGKVTPAGTITLYPIVGTQSTSVTTGPDGNMWYTETGSGAIGRMTTNGAATHFTGTASNPIGITPGPDGAIWFTEKGGGINRIGRMTTAGVLTNEFGGLSNQPLGIVAGPDGNLWFTESGDIGKMTTAGVLTEYAVGSATCQITNGPDGNLWFTACGSSQIGKITTAGAITLYNATGGSDPFGIATGPDGNLWVTEFLANKVARFTTAGVETDYPTLPATLTPGANPLGIVAGADGNIYFTESTTVVLGRVNY